ncbi:MAG: hypothetical protein ACRELZ_07635 [Candidatus Rokuibacteriota bacterium]
MPWREKWSLALTPAGLALVAALVLGSVVASGENSQTPRPTVLVGDELLRIFQEGKDAAEQMDPPEQLSLGTAFDPQQPQPIPSDYR